MSDCPNAEMRDQLPDLAAERLDERGRMVVLVHVEQCAACRAELALLRECRRALGRSTRFDSARVARVVVARTARGSGAPARGWRWADWRVAAAAALLVAAGASLTTIYASRGPGVSDGDTVASIAPTASGAAIGATAMAGASASAAIRQSTEDASASETAGAATELSVGAGVSDLSDAELRALLNEMGTVDALPPTEPEPVIVRVTVASPQGDTE